MLALMQKRQSAIISCNLARVVRVASIFRLELQCSEDTGSGPVALEHLRVPRSS